MPVNVKLTRLLNNRIVHTVEVGPSQFLIHFVDESTMTVKIDEPNSQRPTEGKKIRQISEEQKQLRIQYQDDSTDFLALANPGNSIALRDKNNQIEYLG